MTDDCAHSSHRRDVRLVVVCWVQLWFPACVHTVNDLTKAQKDCPFAKIFFINVAEEPEKAWELKYVGCDCKCGVLIVHFASKSAEFKQLHVCISFGKESQWLCGGQIGQTWKLVSLHRGESRERGERLNVWCDLLSFITPWFLVIGTASYDNVSFNHTTLLLSTTVKYSVSLFWCYVVGRLDTIRETNRRQRFLGVVCRPMRMMMERGSTLFLCVC